MARDTKRMALYEAIKKGQTKRPSGKKTVGLRRKTYAPSKFAKKKKDRTLPHRYDAPGAVEPRIERVDWFFNTKLSFSMSYAGVAILVVAQLVLVAGAVRIGQIYYDKTWLFFSGKTVQQQQKGPDIRDSLFPEAKKPAQKVIETPVPETKEPVTAKRPAGIEKKPVQVVPVGNNVIVIQAYFQRKDLVPVKEYFEKNGIETEILENRYFRLVTKQRYQGFGSGSDGETGLNKIKEIGVKYKAPSGYESFRPNLFQDAYGEKVR